ncbi:MAG: hypothetical protein P0S94_04345 [Simkaniaceae bacterium]|nr:hypothetical protein [Simkaniaceae bacterium]
MKNWKFLFVLTAMLGGFGALSADDASEEPATEVVVDDTAQDDAQAEEVADAAE